MTTKDQERKALEEIRAIVEKVGGDQSYIGMAFKGCFELAEDNITNDFGDSWVDRWSSIVDENNKHIDEISELKRDRDSMEAELKAITDRLENLKEIRNQWKEKAESNETALNENRKALNEIRASANDLELENMKLKAKLYDLMTA